MKKFSKLVAVVLAIAVIICPMMSVVSHATTTGGYKIEAIDANNLKLTINSTDGFIAYHATVGFNSNTAFQSSYNADDYTNGLKVISYTLKTAEENTHNKPAISAEASSTSLSVIVMPSDINNLDLCTEIVIGIRVADGTTASLTKIQAADDGADVTADPTLLTFPAAGSDGVIDSTAQDYIASNATTNAHTHSFTQQTQTAAYLKTAATCTADATYWYSCATCGLASSTEYFTATGTKIAHTPDNTETTLKQAATCTTNALYYQECSVCHTQLETYWEKPNTALGHNMTFHAATSSTCKVQGNIEYYSCSRCGKFFAEESGTTELTAEQTKRALAAHTPLAAVVENNVSATCTTAGSYDSVVYCSVCGEEISRETVVVQTTEHTPAAAVTENEVAATCTAQGSYDSVVYCSVCGAEISRETVNVPTIAHTVVEDAAVAATCTETGLTAGTHCSVCGTILTAQTEVPALGHAYTYDANGNGTHTVGCGRCDYSAQEACDTEGTDGVCSKCGYKATPAHEHTWIVDTITQPTKTSTGLRTWKCSDPDCHETKEPDVLAIPTYVAATKVFESCDLCVDEAVYPRIAITNANVFSVSGADSYYLVVDYDKFASTDVAKYVKRTESVTFNMSDKTGQNKNGSKWYYALHDIPIYGMGNQFQVTIYMVKDGVATGYWESQPTCIAALAEASYGLVDTLDRCLADLVQYGNELLKYFAYNYPDSDLSKAPLLDTYFSHLDDATSLDLANIPYTSVNNSSALTETNIKLVGSTNVIIGDSNQIRYRVSVPLAYDTSKLTAIVHYNNGYGNEVSKTYTTDNMTFFRTTATANEYYIYFTNCALYDLEKTLTIDVYYDEVKQYTNAYTLGTYVNNNSTVTTAGLDNVVKAMGISYESVKSHLFATKPYITD